MEVEAGGEGPIETAVVHAARAEPEVRSPECVLGRRSSPEVPRKSRAARSEVLGIGVWELEGEAACQMAVVHAARTEPEVRSQEDAS